MAGKKREDLVRQEEFSKAKIEIIGEAVWKDSALMIPLVRQGGKVGIVLERRASQLHFQPCQVSFPGGSLEKGESPKEAAVRECHEELLVPEEKIQVFGQAYVFISASFPRIHVFIGTIPDYQGTFSQNEIDQVLFIPVEDFEKMEKKVYFNHTQVQADPNFPFEDLREGRDYQFLQSKIRVVFYYWHDQVIWGITARILEESLPLIQRYGMEDWVQ